MSTDSCRNSGNSSCNTYSFIKSFVKLKLELIDGIKLREWRWKTKGSQPYVRKFKAPKWDGSFPLQDKTLLVWGEQGPGDIIIWCSCLDYLTSICANIIVECLPKFVTLTPKSLDILSKSSSKSELCKLKNL